MRLPLIALLLAGTGTGTAHAVEAAAAAVTAQPDAATAAGAGSASPTTPGEEAEEEDAPVRPRAGEIVVVATRIKGQVEAPQAPIVVMDEEDIAAYGAASLTDLIDQLSPETGSGRGRGSGRPVILLNGQRISNFREMRNIPPEAIRRLEILPEEVALRFGYPADQRVINFILKDNFAAKTVEVEYSQPDQGGTSTLKGEGSLFRTDGLSRLNIAVTADDTTPLFESERNVAQATGSVAGAAAARTLVADSRDLGVNATWTTGLGQKGLAGSLALNGAFTRADTTSYSGLDAVTFDPLARAQRTDTAEAGITYARPLGAWQLTTTLDGSHAAATTLIDQNGTSGVDRARSVSDSLTSLVTVVGRPLSLPAGEVATTLKAGFAYTGIASSDTRNTLGEFRLKRGDASAGINLGIPIASRRNHVLPAIGDLNLNFSAGVDRLSDFGTLFDWSGGLTWGVTQKLNLQASYIYNQAAPALTDLGNPLVQSFNVSVYDFTTGQTVLATVLTGGNPSLARQTQKDLKIGANWQLPFLSNSNVLVEYFHNDSDNITSAFPVLTPAIEAAFPGRVVRNGAGQIVSIDRRPVTFANETSSRLRYGFNIGGQFGKASAAAAQGGPFGGGGFGGPPPGGGGGMGGPPPGGGGGFGGGGRGGGGRGGGQPGRGRWNVSLYHTVQFYDRVTVAAGGPVLDLLNGDALTSGGVARHSLEFEGGGFYRGIGLRFNGKWTAPTNVRSSGTPGSNDLRFGALTKINFRLFADLGQQASLVKDHPFFKGARLSFKVDNILNARQRVTDQTGATPISYQPALMDPLGRVIGLEFRKQF
ncbi:TonB-dependent receptor [Novosphingobium flavum]|uniref:TonB-dependent receptor n=1 Tax=Novosphingobium flavum TaxID=1778672 RepID=A0A7X1FTC1_9SPHN|nr:TonB-dependent receptor [Novosphingobium flavum]MBC2666573.1 TonB-dependent receptor [Novosphingobium flavum]